jgi:hypothetical protein
MELGFEVVFKGNNKGCDERLWKFWNNLHGNSSVMWLGVNVLGIKNLLGIVSRKEYMHGQDL